jgi:hypothetical protein
MNLQSLAIVCDIHCASLSFLQPVAPNLVTLRLSIGGEMLARADLFARCIRLESLDLTNTVLPLSRITIPNDVLFEILGLPFLRNLYLENQVLEDIFFAIMYLVEGSREVKPGLVLTLDSCVRFSDVMLIADEDDEDVD